MNEFEFAKELLEKIVVKDIPFAMILRSSFKKKELDPTFKTNVSSLLGCELRHHLLFTDLIKRFVGEIEFEKTIYLRFFLANYLYLKRFNNDDLKSLALADISKENFDEIFGFVANNKNLISEDLNKFSPAYLSLRFNTPEWVIKMWQKQYSKKIAYEVLKANYHISIPVVRVNEKLVDIDKFLEKYADFARTNIENTLIYQGRGTPKNLPEIKDNRVFFMKLATKQVLDRLEIEPLKRIAVYSDVPNNIYLEMVSSFGKDVEFDMIINHLQSYYETKRNVEEHGYNNIHLYNASCTSVITCVSYPVHTMICLPKSSALDLLRSVPDYFLRVKQENLDDLIAGEVLALEECARVVEEEGRLFYMIPTLCKKESVGVITSFLSKHSEFELIEEKQYLPFEEYDSCLYYAIMKKKGAARD